MCDAVIAGTVRSRHDPRGSSGRRGVGDQCPEAMIASRTLDQFVTVDGSRNYAQEGNVRLLVSEPHEFVDQIRAPPSAAHFDLKLIVRARSGQGRLIGP